MQEKIGGLRKGDVENVLWKLGEEPKAEEAKSLADKKVVYGGGDAGATKNLTKEGTLPGVDDVLAYSVSPQSRYFH